MREQDKKPCDDLELYVIDGLDESDKAAFLKHLSTCNECKNGLQELQSIVDLLPYAAPEVEVPSGMRARIMSNVLGESFTAGDTEQTKGTEPAPPETVIKPASPASLTREQQAVVEKVQVLKENVSPSRPKRYDWKSVANIGLVAAVAISCFYNIKFSNEINRLQPIADGLNSPIQGAKTNEVVTLNPAAEGLVAKGLATIMINSKGTHLIVSAENLPELQTEEAFQVWLIKGDKVVNAGTFQSRKGSGAIFFTLEPAVPDYDQIAITLEPDAYGDLPRGKAILAADI
ncbi:hypothetical protein SY83_19590 [Paenibacillus swuensis]|uniref:Regulator of SigK n=1 Tax=Paenibacillus swuensis TaxID=1178515 RepID=A0A172TMJ4_9BACL|nr:anti-sigma factor [Paenibacillus swuensis]ANE48124.1 hypothetical protein SY83_19590 [Paenibacillus swuensis]